MKCLSARYHKNLVGFTLSEAAIVLGVVGLILGIIWGAATTVHQRAATEDMLHNISVMAQNIRTLYSTRGAFTGGAGADLTAMLRNADAFPAQMFYEAPAVTPRTPWGTNVRVLVTTATTFEIALDPNLPTEHCLSLVTRLLGTGRDPGLIDVLIDGAPIGAANMNTSGVANLPAACTRLSLIFTLNPQ